MNLSETVVKLDSLEVGEKFVLTHNKNKLYTITCKDKERTRGYPNSIGSTPYLVCFNDDLGNKYFTNSTEDVYKVIPVVKLGELKRGEKFKFKDEMPRGVYMKLGGTYRTPSGTICSYVTDDTWGLWTYHEDHEVEKVNKECPF